MQMTRQPMAHGNSVTSATIDAGNGDVKLETLSLFVQFVGMVTGIFRIYDYIF